MLGAIKCAMGDILRTSCKMKCKCYIIKLQGFFGVKPLVFSTCTDHIAIHKRMFLQDSLHDPPFKKYRRWHLLFSRQ